MGMGLYDRGDVELERVVGYEMTVIVWYGRVVVSPEGEPPINLALGGLGRPRAPVIVEIPRVVGGAWSGGLRSYRRLVEVVDMKVDVVRGDKPPADLNGWWCQPHIPTRGEEALGGWSWSFASARDSRNPPHTSRW